MSRYVLDSFALLALYRNEPGGGAVGQLLTDRRHEHWMTYLNLGEVYYRVAREHGRAAADQALVWTNQLAISFSEADRSLTLAAARLKAAYRISYADCFVAALAQQLDAAVVTGDPDFALLEADTLVTIEWLARKPKRSR